MKIIKINDNEIDVETTATTKQRYYKAELEEKKNRLREKIREIDNILSKF